MLTCEEFVKDTLSSNVVVWDIANEIDIGFENVRSLLKDFMIFTNYETYKNKAPVAKHKNEEWRELFIQYATPNINKLFIDEGKTLYRIKFLDKDETVKYGIGKSLTEDSSRASLYRSIEAAKRAASSLKTTINYLHVYVEEVKIIPRNYASIEMKGQGCLIKTV